MGNLNVSVRWSGALSNMHHGTCDLRRKSAQSWARAPPDVEIETIDLYLQFEQLDDGQTRNTQRTSRQQRTDTGGSQSQARRTVSSRESEPDSSAEAHRDGS